jgi:hypothetical protein
MVRLISLFFQPLKRLGTSFPTPLLCIQRNQLNLHDIICLRSANTMNQRRGKEILRKNSSEFEGNHSIFLIFNVSFV